MLLSIDNISSIVVCGFVLILLKVVQHLKIVSSHFRLSAFEKFNEYLDESVSDRIFLYQFSDTPLELSSQQEKHFQNVINSLNRITVLLEYRMIPPKLAFGVCHTLIIRCEYKLGYYMDHQELKIGGRYGRRVRKLAKRAKIYHDINPIHRIHPIKVTQGDETVIIYETNIHRGLIGLIQRLEWFIRRIFRVY